MLTQLFSSQVRVKILRFLVMEPNNSFTATEVANKTGSIIRSVNKEITKLVSTNIIIEEIKEIEVNKKKTKVKHYHADKLFFLFSEIKDLFLKLQVLDLDDFKQKLIKTGNLNYIVLCGKFIGDGSTSIDLLIIGQANHKKIEKVVKDFEKNSGFEINWAAMELEEYDYRQQIGDIFLHNILSCKKIEILNKFV